MASPYRIPDSSQSAQRAARVTVQTDPELLEVARSTGSERPISRKEACGLWSFENSDECEVTLFWEVSCLTRGRWLGECPYKPQS